MALRTRLGSDKNLNPSFYLDLRKERKNQRQGETAYTPAVNLIYGLETALDMMLSEGIENVWTRREKINRAVIEGAVALGCKQYAERVSPAVAALYVPEGMSAPDIVKGFSKRGARIASGQDDAKPHMLRPSVVGYADGYDALTVVAVLEGCFT